MTVTEHLNRWRESGIITEDQFATISSLVLKQRFSVFLELNALLYLGVLALVTGLAWTAQTYSTTLGDALILTILTALLTGCLYYCFSRPADLFLDYVLYAGCLILSVELAYIENRFNLLGAARDHYLLFTFAVFLALAYRFDNRFVLSLALSALAGWFGLRFSRFGLLTADSVRLYALVYGGLVAGAGFGLYMRGLKRHFLDTYLHIATNVVLMALLSGLGKDQEGWFYFLALLGLCSLSVFLGVHFRRFVFVAYGILYGYIGTSYQLLKGVVDETLVLTYFVASGTVVVISLIVLARRFGREE